MPPIATVVIPAAGKGLRLLDFRRSGDALIPKPLLETGRGPALVDILETLRRTRGLRGPGLRIRIVVPKGDSRIPRFLRNHYRGNPFLKKIRFKSQERPRGPLDAIACALPARGRVLIWLADTLFENPPEIQWDRLYAARVSGDLRRWCLARKGPNGEVLGLVDKPKRSRGAPRHALIGLYAFSESRLFKEGVRKILKKNRRRRGEFQLSQGIEVYLEKRNLFLKETFDWLDVGEPRSLLKARKRLARNLR